jgi:polysaccharide export outer membrane protein
MSFRERAILAVIAIWLPAVCLAGCKTDDSFDGATTAASQTRSPSDGITPSFNSTQQEASRSAHGSPSVERVSDASAVRTANELALVASPGAHSYKIGPQDVLEISVFQAPDLSATIEVDESGEIDMPLIGAVPAAGQTPGELQRTLSAKLGAKYLQNPQVTVRVKEYNSNRVTVSGAVKSPGVFPYKGQTLLQLVAMSGGFASDSNSMVLVLRQSNGKRAAAKFNVADIEGGRTEDPTLQAGDVIVADTSTMKRGLNNILKVLPLAGFAALL